MHSFTLDIDGRTHHVYQHAASTNDALPLVALHGFGVTGRSFRFVAPGLAEAGVRTVAPDLLGFGGSDKPNRGYSLHRYARLTDGLRRKLDLERPFLLGHSFGGKIALATAVQYPEQYAGLILVATAGFNRLDRLAGWADGPVAGAFLRPWATRLARRFAIGQVVADPESLTALRRFNGSFGALDLHATGIIDRLRGIDLPVLVVWGEHDRITPPRHAYRVTRALPHARLVTLSGAGHVPMRDRPERFVEEVTAFMKTV